MVVVVVVGGGKYGGGDGGGGGGDGVSHGLSQAAHIKHSIWYFDPAHVVSFFAPTINPIIIITIKKERFTISIS